MEYVEQDNPPIFLEINTNDQINNSENVLENIVQLADEPDESTTIAEPMVNKYYYPVKYEEYNPKDLIACTVKINNEAEVFNSLMNLKVQADVINTLPILDTIQEHLDLSISSEPSNSYPSSDDLDFLMDFAFLHKEQRNFIQALNTFRQALLLYPDSEVAPFLVVEMGTILKNFGSYNEAIQVFIEGRLLPGVINNSMLDQEFINNIAYLRVVKNILIQNSLEFMPFNRIPNNIFKEIDAEFYEWRNQS